MVGVQDEAPEVGEVAVKPLMDVKHGLTIRVRGDGIVFLDNVERLPYIGDGRPCLHGWKSGRTMFPLWNLIE